MSVNIIHLLVIISFIPLLVFSGYPLSDPYNGLGMNGKILPYNLIDTNPKCFWNGACPFRPGGALGTFPNSEERFQHILHNMHRMFPNNSLATPLGSRVYGIHGDDSRFTLSGRHCGGRDQSRMPQWWYSTANQMARFKQWDENSCDQSWYYYTYPTTGKENDPHVTCAWGSSTTVSFKGTNVAIPSDRCELFSGSYTESENNCGLEARSNAFCDAETQAIDRCWFESEGLCGGNSCIDSPSHCDPIFANKNDYVGKGFIQGMNGAASVYNRFGKSIWYLLPIGAHFDERVKVHPDDLRTDGKHFGLMLEYFDANYTQTPEACYALYDGAIHELPVFLSNNHPHEIEATNYRAGATFPELHGRWNPTPGFYSSDSNSVLFLQYFDPPESTCEPYAFICRTSQQNMVRLPEDGDYYFGTEWIDWRFTDYDKNQKYSCKENHYYSHPLEGWTVNGGPTLTQSDIWYYQEKNECIGCDGIDILDCLSQCVYEQDGVPTQKCQDSCGPPTPPTNKATPNPSRNTLSPSDHPTTVQPSQFPTAVPSHDPTSYPTKLPTQSPTLHPTNFPTLNPTKLPTLNPTKLPTLNPTKLPTLNPTKLPTQSPTLNPTKLSTKSPTHNPTLNPTNLPTPNPSSTPTKSPTFNPTDKPTKLPTKSPTYNPSSTPTKSPTKYPTNNPTPAPSTKTRDPTKNPTPVIPTTAHPSRVPTPAPSMYPTSYPTDNPTLRPTKRPTSNPTQSPTLNPTKLLTKSPTHNPTLNPTKVPTPEPNPSSTPTLRPTKLPTSNPTRQPTTQTRDPTKNPSHVIPTTAHPSRVTTAAPFMYPTSYPTGNPTSSPTKRPTPKTGNPTTNPSSVPSYNPTKPDTQSPTSSPSINTAHGLSDCDSIINYKTTWLNIESWNETTYLELGRQEFIKSYSECGDAVELEFFYRFEYVAPKLKLKINIHVCCGEGKRFGETYTMPANYKANQAWIDHNKRSKTSEEGNEWFDWKYIVFALIVIIGVLCCVGWCKKRKKKIRYNPSLQAQTRVSEENIIHMAERIRMYGMSTAPGARTMETQTGERGSTDGSSDSGKHRENSLLNPPMRHLQHVLAAPSVSFDTPYLD